MARRLRFGDEQENHAMDRLPPIPESLWTAEQRAEAEPIIKGPRGALVSPFVPLLRSPELMGHVQRMGEYLRYRSALPPRSSELAILVTARRWTQQVEWAIHAPIAVARGVPAQVVDDIAHGRTPSGLDDDARLVYRFCSELQAKQDVGDATWNAFVERFGEKAAIDLTGIVGYYTLLSMVMNVARTPAPPSTASPLPALEPDLARVCRDYIACLNRRDWASLGDLVQDDVRRNGVALGLAGYQRMLEENAAQIPDLQFEIRELVADPPRAAARLWLEVTPRGEFLGLPVNGRKVAFAENVFYEFREGRIQEVWSVIDKAAIEAQLRQP
jgi:4-carboxymuconolactone decarboxylase